MRPLPHRSRVRARTRSRPTHALPLVLGHEIVGKVVAGDASRRSSAAGARTRGDVVRRRARSAGPGAATRARSRRCRATTSTADSRRTCSCPRRRSSSLDGAPPAMRTRRVSASWPTRSRRRTRRCSARGARVGRRRVRRRRGRRRRLRARRSRARSARTSSRATSRRAGSRSSRRSARRRDRRRRRPRRRRTCARSSTAARASWGVPSLAGASSSAAARAPASSSRSRSSRRAATIVLVGYTRDAVERPPLEPDGVRRDRPRQLGLPARALPRGPRPHLRAARSRIEPVRRARADVAHQRAPRRDRASTDSSGASSSIPARPERSTP